MNNLFGFSSAYIFGSGENGQIMRRILEINHIEFLGFIDNKNPSALKLEDIEITPDKTVLVASYSGTYQIGKQLETRGIKNYYLLHELVKLYPQFDEFPRIKGMSLDYETNKNSFEKLSSCFKDQKSLEVYKALCDIRKSPCHNYAVFHDIRSEEDQYCLPELLEYPEFLNLPFVDCGAFTGDSAQAYLKSWHTLKKDPVMYLLEPDPDNLAKARENLADQPNVNYLQIGAWDEDCTLSFSSAGNSASHIASNGTIDIQCRRLDDVICEDKVFIKMDIEGAELNALKGARRLITNGSVLAICVYHDPSHMHRIPEYILSVNKNYTFYLRHYSDGWDETVLYAVSKKGVK